MLNIIDAKEQKNFLRSFLQKLSRVIILIKLYI